MTCRVLLLVLLAPTVVTAADRTLQGNPNLLRYFENEVATLEERNSLLKYETLAAWEREKPKLRAQLFDMLGMSPLPERTTLDATVTGTIEEQDFVVEKLHFQSMPGLYVTANFYRPKQIDKPLPTVLYVCGHARVRDGEVSIGNKAGYQHHGAWFARNGYTCLTIDTIQLGEIEGVHHGTYSHNRWWWNSRGYSPAGVEAWNCMRALDYLETRPEVDSNRFGVTGRSGGGAYSWWIAALDERIKCAIPVAGITSLRNHVVDGCVEGHCDCMYMVNTYRWDYAKVAALVAPRPLLISNSDKDGIFPLDGVVAVHRQVRDIYDLYEKPRQLGLHITEGPHKDTQELRIHAFRWLNRWLKQDESLIEMAAKKRFEPPQLKVFESLPADEIVTSIDNDFAPLATQATDRMEQILNHQQDWAETALALLRKHSFAAWPEDAELEKSAAHAKSEPLELAEALTSSGEVGGALRLHFESQKFVPLSVDLILPTINNVGDGESNPKATTVKSVQLRVLNSDEWNAYQQSCLAGEEPTSADKKYAVSVVKKIRSLTKSGTAVAVFAPRGTGPHAWVGDQKKQTQIRRRFQLIGTTADAMRVWDIRSALAVLRGRCPNMQDVDISGEGSAGWLALTALLFDGNGISGNFTKLSSSRDEFPVFLNAARFLTPHEFVGLALRNASIRVTAADASVVDFAKLLTTDNRWKGQAFSAD